LWVKVGIKGMTMGPDNEYEQIYAAEERRTSAMVEGDVPALELLIEDDCRYVHSSGAVDTKTSYLDQLRSGAVAYSWVRLSEQSILDLGGGVVVSHRMDAKMVLSGVERPYRSRAVAIWRSTANGPRLAFFQATALPQ
jgi:hypothetical protein